MALVTALQLDERKFRSIHPTELVARYIVAEADGRKVLQLNTYGSSGRDVPDKLSQTLQFDENTARHLFDLLGREFGFKKEK